MFMGMVVWCMLQGFQTRGIGPAKPLVGTYHALVIGINHYRDRLFADLKAAENDARGMAKALKKTYGFHLQPLLLNQAASRQGILNALRQVESKITVHDSLLIFFAGHSTGTPDGKEGWWIPADAVFNQYDTYLPNHTIGDAIAKLKARHVLLIADSCYAGTLFSRTRMIPNSFGRMRLYFETYGAMASRWGFTSANLSLAGDEAKEGHSWFSYYLLKVLGENRLRYLTPHQVFIKMAPDVIAKTQQIPRCEPLNDPNHEGGRFFFIRRDGLAEDPEEAPFRPPQIDGDLLDYFAITDIRPGNSQGREVVMLGLKCIRRIRDRDLVFNLVFIDRVGEFARGQFSPENFIGGFRIWEPGQMGAAHIPMPRHERQPAQIISFKVH